MTEPLLRAWGERVAVEPLEPVSPSGSTTILVTDNPDDVWYGRVIDTGGPRLHRRSRVALPSPVECGERIVYRREGAVVVSVPGGTRIDIVPDDRILLVVDG